MELQLTTEQTAFRDEVRSFLKEKLPDDIRDASKGAGHLTAEMFTRWHGILAEKGWSVPLWPEKHGGTGWSPVEYAIFDEECHSFGAPKVLPFSVSMLGPVLIAFGNDHLKEKFLPGIIDGSDWWCQGFSEPGSGSDLASLKTSAIREGDHYIVNGQKTWTTLGQHADWIFCLVRTDTNAPKPQMGISFILMPMDLPGIEVRPIITLDGSHEVNEVFFDNVKVPAEYLVGEENKGWTYAKFLLQNERIGIAGIGGSKEQLYGLKRLAAAEKKNGKPLIEDQNFKTKLAEVEIELRALDITNKRMLVETERGMDPGPVSSMLKIRGSEVAQRLYELKMEASGLYALPFQPELETEGWNDEMIGSLENAISAPRYLNTRKISIFGGSNEIQRGIISKMVLGF
ncbi:acyl-CoA dehydrogenase family protein [Kordiimonas sp. SCSIO 12603]|uniref:acyl-CoA dehydrogenase family protein n=1 Tax=Kordiimonas sp. SCSIO 12603 TaxID=2829596 RepID=UPI0021028ED6|nr:acyl-CoA dehydrogenase family protein [Kordiimonas sp. SCSIO 12603]UTW57808.1 acyl-CoA dehydrogenase family protein [Kordiimonas sp. SCSIO 12603]